MWLTLQRLVAAATGHVRFESTQQTDENIRNEREREEGGGAHSVSDKGRTELCLLIAEVAEGGGHVTLRQREVGVDSAADEASLSFQPLPG